MAVANAKWTDSPQASITVGANGHFSCIKLLCVERGGGKRGVDAEALFAMVERSFQLLREQVEAQRGSSAKCRLYLLYVLAPRFEVLAVVRQVTRT